MAKDFTIGKQATLVLVSDGAIVGTAGLTDFSKKQQVVKLKSRPLNTVPIHRNIPDGWGGDFGFDRIDPTLDDYFSNQEEAYWQGSNAPAIYIQETVQENDGSVSQYRYDGVQMEFDGGTYKSDEINKQKVTWEASRRRKVL